MDGNAEDNEKQSRQVSPKDHGPFFIDAKGFDKSLGKLVGKFKKYGLERLKENGYDSYFIKTDNKVIALITMFEVDGGKSEVILNKLVSTKVSLEALVHDENHALILPPNIEQEDFCLILAKYLVEDRKAEDGKGKRILDSGNTYPLMLIKIADDNGIEKEIHLNSLPESEETNQPFHPVLTETETKDIKKYWELLHDNKTLLKIAVEMGFHERTLKRLLDKAGIKHKEAKRGQK